MNTFSPFKPLSRLYSLGHIKEVDSPRSEKECSESSKPSTVVSDTLLPSKSEQQIENYKTLRSPKSQIQEDLENSIDDLFTKIQKIKSEFTPNEQFAPLSFVKRTNSVKSQKISYHKDWKNVLEARDQNRPQKSPEHQLLFRKPSTQSPRKIGIQDFQLGKTLGEGKFGDVLQCRHKATGTIYAIKKIFKSTIQQYNMINQLAQQLKIHYSLDHKNIVKLYKHFEDQYHIFLLMEYLDGNTLMNIANREEQNISQIICQTLQGLEYLHKRQIAHRDIKPENIILSHGLVKICDFGWAANCDTGMKKTFCGTLDYVSPQILQQRQYSISVDLWSIGVLTFELLTGFAPFNQPIPKLKINKIKNIDKEKVLFPPHISSEGRDFITGFLKKRPQERMSLREAMNHPFIVNHKKKQSQINCI